MKTMRHPITALLIFGLLGCSSPRKASTQTPTGELSRAGESALLPTQPPSQNLPRALTPEPHGPSDPYRSSFSFYNSGRDAAVAAVLIGTAFALGHVVASSAPRTDLRGFCQYGRADQAAFGAPCIHVTVLLLSEAKDVVATTTTNEDGDFRFYLPANQNYFVKIVDRKDRSALLQKKVTRADFVSILLEP